MLQEGIAWFGALTPNVVVTVNKPAPVTYPIGPGTSVTVEGSGINVSLESVESVTGAPTAWVKVQGQSRQVINAMRPGQVIRLPVGTVTLNSVSDPSSLGKILNNQSQSQQLNAAGAGGSCRINIDMDDLSYSVDDEMACVKAECVRTIGWDACEKCFKDNMGAVTRELNFSGNLLKDWLLEVGHTRVYGELDLYLTLTGLNITMSQQIMNAIEGSMGRVNDAMDRLDSCIGD
jgi:hypothetical protein